MGADVTSYEVELGFLPPSLAIADPKNPGLLRAGPRNTTPYGDSRIDQHWCQAVDLAQSTTTVSLIDEGFDIVDLSPLTALQATLHQVHRQGSIHDNDAAAIRRALSDAVLETRSGASLHVRYIADEGLIMRTSGPNRLSTGQQRSKGMNGHQAATSVHADQDVYGTPLAQIMDGNAPSLFRHDSPNGQNHDANLMLLNCWIPLQQITQPLVLADGRSIDRQRHQLRLGLPTGSFLDRNGDMAINDIWTFLYDPRQEWYFTSELASTHAYVFNTLSTPHGAGVLPGEVEAQACVSAIEKAETYAASHDLDGFVAALNDAPSQSTVAPTTPALSEATSAMQAVIANARNQADAIVGTAADEWIRHAKASRQPLIRQSIELRFVAHVHM